MDSYGSLKNAKNKNSALTLITTDEQVRADEHNRIGEVAERGVVNERATKRYDRRRGSSYLRSLAGNPRHIARIRVSRIGAVCASVPESNEYFCARVHAGPVDL
jgi:hypothetical protein